MSFSDPPRAFLLIGLGSNEPGPLGSPRETLQWAVRRLNEHLDRLVESSVYHTRPQHRADQPWYYNQVVAGYTCVTPRRLLSILNRLEAIAGRDRDREARFGPRSLDMDILTWGSIVIASPDLAIPHPRMHMRRFVLEPLLEVAPTAKDPRTGKLWSSFTQVWTR